MNDQDEASAIHEHLRDVPIRERDRADDSPDFENVEAEAAFWRAQFERERERLVKLWVAYKDLEAALELRKNETGAVAERKVAARLSEGLDALPGLESPAPDTNIVMVDSEAAGLTAEAFVDACKDAGVGAVVFDEYTTRFTTHRDVDRDDVETALDRIGTVVA